MVGRIVTISPMTVIPVDSAEKFADIVTVAAHNDGSNQTLLYTIRGVIMDLLERVYADMLSENAITDTFGDIDVEAMASVFSDYMEEDKAVVQKFFMFYSPLMDVNGFKPMRTYRDVLAAMEEL